MKTKPLLAVLAVVAAGALAVTLVGPGGADEDPTPRTGTVLATPVEPVDVVALSTPAQAAIAVSSRLFTSSRVAVVTDDRAADRTEAIGYARRLGVPVLLDDPATPAELTRLRARTVLTVGQVEPVVGSREATAAEVDRLARDRTPADETSSIVLLTSTATYDVAVQTAENAGAEVVATKQGDPRRDRAVARALTAAPKAPVIALGDTFTDDLTYTAAAVRAGATQPGGGYRIFPDRVLVGLEPGDRSTDAATTLLQGAVKRFGQQRDEPAGGFFELPVTPSTRPAALTASIAAAREADLQVVLALRPGASTFVQQTRRLESVLSGRDVGLELDVASLDRSVTAAEVEQAAAYLASLVDDGALPQKLLLVNVDDPDAELLPDPRPELALAVGVDVGGDPATKLAAWSAAREGAPRGTAFGWRQLRGEDTPRFSFGQIVRRVSPAPDLVLYD